MEWEKVLRAGIDIGSLFCLFVIGCLCIYDKIFGAPHRKALAAGIDKLNDLHSTVKGIEATTNLIATNLPKRVLKNKIQ